MSEGADLLDGAAVHPPAASRSRAEALRRVVPLARGLASEGITVSVDTMRARVAAEAVAAGAVLVNDVSGGLADPDMVPAVAETGVPFVVMHWRGFSASMNSRAVYGDVVAEVLDELRQRMDAVIEGGIAPERVVIDPGLGFAKDAAHDLALVARLDRLHTLGRPLLVAASRKRFLGHVLPARLRPAARPGTRRGDRRRLRALRRRRRLGRPGPRGTGHRRRGPRRPRGRGSRVNESTPAPPPTSPRSRPPTPPSTRRWNAATSTPSPTAGCPARS
ncbi:hypothetical protein SCALM49S_10065 [Streptomyces californicus]